MATVTETGKEVGRENIRDITALKKFFISAINKIYSSTGNPNSSEAEQYIGQINAATSMDKLVGLADTFKAKATGDFIRKAVFPNSSLEYLMAKKLSEAYKDLPASVTNTKAQLSNLELDIHDADGDGSVTDYVKTGANRAKTILDDAPKTPVGGPTGTPIGETDGPTETPKPKVGETDGPTKTPKPKVGETDGPTTPSITKLPMMITDGDGTTRDLSKLSKPEQVAIASHIRDGGTFAQIDRMAAIYIRNDPKEIAQWESFVEQVQAKEKNVEEKLNDMLGATASDKFDDKIFKSGGPTASLSNKIVGFGGLTGTSDNKGDKFVSLIEDPNNSPNSSVSPTTPVLPTTPSVPTPAAPIMLNDGSVTRNIAGLSAAEQTAIRTHIEGGGTFAQIDAVAAIYESNDLEKIDNWERFTATGKYAASPSPTASLSNKIVGFGGLTGTSDNKGDKFVSPAQTPNKSSKFGGGTLGSNDSAVNSNIVIPTFPPSNVI